MRDRIPGMRSEILERETQSISTVPKLLTRTPSKAKHLPTVSSIWNQNKRHSHVRSIPDCRASSSRAWYSPLRIIPRTMVTAIVKSTIPKIPHSAIFFRMPTLTLQRMAIGKQRTFKVNPLVNLFVNINRARYHTKNIRTTIKNAVNSSTNRDLAQPRIIDTLTRAQHLINRPKHTREVIQAQRDGATRNVKKHHNVPKHDVLPDLAPKSAEEHQKAELDCVHADHVAQERGTDTLEGYICLVEEGRAWGVSAAGDGDHGVDVGAYELREDCCCGEEDECHEHEVVVEEEAFEDGVADVESEEVGDDACCEACPGCDLFGGERVD